MGRIYGLSPLIMYDMAFLEKASVQSTKQLKFPQPIANSIVVKTLWYIQYYSCNSSQTHL